MFLPFTSILYNLQQIINEYKKFIVKDGEYPSNLLALFNEYLWKHFGRNLIHYNNGSVTDYDEAKKYEKWGSMPSITNRKITKISFSTV